jgi:hypothetical protein
MTPRSLLVTRVAGFALVIVLSLCISNQALRSQDQEKEASSPPKANVFAYPDKLTEKDKLVDGPSGTIIKIGGETTLIWVDLAPDYRFAHPTEYVLISVDGARVIKGHWWPVLNGKPLFRNTTPYNAEFPIKMVGI